MPKRHRHTKSQLNNLSVNADPQHPVYREAMTAIQKRLQYMTDKHCQVFVGHLEFRFPPEMEPQDNNQHISNAIRKCRMKLKREKIDTQLVWAREQRTSEQPHYHCYPICDGNEVQSAVRIARFFNDVWAREIGCPSDSNYVRYCPPQGQAEGGTGIRIRRNAPDTESRLNDASHWMSYAAKVSEKEKTPGGCRMFGFTEIP
ncbi:inovirus-type Gp2 protein [Victivallis sp. Marseille-Q1083]|uniref:YagK/YfjJ domain-containing protein n=1 Tax=Victivallis sp. Marseille-Q1083 TaxID=2717288 RepID=UPI00158D1EC8|nr:inovirus-type Gp2 protein [Victivallis sp. Marseille-Q1083]